MAAATGITVVEGAVGMAVVTEAVVVDTTVAAADTVAVIAAKSLSDQPAATGRTQLDLLA
jgi:hypothetical protein